MVFAACFAMALRSVAPVTFGTTWERTSPVVWSSRNSTGCDRPAHRATSCGAHPADHRSMSDDAHRLGDDEEPERLLIMVLEVAGRVLGDPRPHIVLCLASALDGVDDVGLGHQVRDK